MAIVGVNGTVDKRMDWQTLITELGGGLSAVVIAGLAWYGLSRDKRVETLTDKFIDQNGENIAAMKDLTAAIRERREPN